MLDIAEGHAISTTSVACYSIHCAEVLEAKVGPIIHLCGIPTGLEHRRMEGQQQPPQRTKDKD